MPITNKEHLREILTTARVIAVVGHSDRKERTSYQIGQMLKSVGYRVYPVNPTVRSIDGDICYPSLAVVREPIDIVNVFRRSEYLAEVVEEAIRVGAKTIWAQLGVYDAEAVCRAEMAGLQVIMDQCIKVVYYDVVPK